MSHPVLAAPTLAGQSSIPDFSHALGYTYLKGENLTEDDLHEAFRAVAQSGGEIVLDCEWSTLSNATPRPGGLGGGKVAVLTIGYDLVDDDMFEILVVHLSGCDVFPPPIAELFATPDVRGRAHEPRSHSYAPRDTRHASPPLPPRNRGIIACSFCERGSRSQRNSVALGSRGSFSIICTICLMSSVF